MIDAETLRRILDYDPLTGIFTNVVGWRKAIAGMRTGRRKPDGYRVICIHYNEYFEHRLAWFYVHGTLPENDIDHINHDPSDNRLTNLRETTRSQNMMNGTPYNKSELKGVYQHHRNKNKWVAQIVVNGKNKYSGWYDSAKEAHAVYSMAAIAFFGEFACVC